MQSLVRFPNSLAFGSELGLHCPYRRGIFLSTLAARPICTGHGRKGAHWVSQHLRKPHDQSQLFSLTGLASSSRFLSSTHLQLLLEPFISHGFLIFQLLYFSPAEKTVSSSHLQLLLERSSVFLKLCFQISPVPVPADYPIPSSTLSEIGVSFETSKLHIELISADVSCRPFAMHISLAVVLLVQKSAVAMSIKSF